MAGAKGHLPDSVREQADDIDRGMKMKYPGKIKRTAVQSFFTLCTAFGYDVFL